MGLDALHELTQVITKNKLRDVELLHPASTGRTKLMEFYEWLLDNRSATDEEALTHFYDDEGQYKSYEKLKFTLKNRLINTVFFIDIKRPSYNDRKRAYYECYKDWAAAKVLLSRNARITGMELCRKILKQAKRFEFTELTLDIYRMLRLHYGTIEGDIKKFEKYNEQFKHYEALWQQENLAEELYTNLIIRYINAKANTEDITKKAREALQQIEPALAKYSAYKLQLCGLLIRLLIHSTTNDQEQTLKICHDSIKLFKAKKYNADVPLQACYHQLLISCIQLRKFEQGQEAATACLQLASEGSFNWFKYQELFFLLSMHTGEYQNAYRTWQHITNHKKYRFLSENNQEIWRIYGAFVHYLVELGHVTSKLTDEFERFRIQKFVNDTPIYSKDKSGMNIPIIVVQIIFMIAYRKYDDAIDRIEAIEKYCYRHLTDGATLRSNYFIKMLLQIPAASFQKDEAIARAQKYLEKLRSNPIDMANYAHEIEIIPYEDLWQLVLESLMQGEATSH